MPIKPTNFTCLGHEGQPLETIIHKFWECPRAKVTWPWVLSFVCRLKFSTNVDKLQKGLEMEHCFFNKQIVEENSTIQPNLDIIQGCNKYGIFCLKRNDIIFNRRRYYDAQLAKSIWRGHQDYGGGLNGNTLLKRLGECLVWSQTGQTIDRAMVPTPLNLCQGRQDCTVTFFTS